MVTLFYIIPMILCIAIACAIIVNYHGAFDGTIIFFLSFVPMINILVLIFLIYLFITSYKNS